MSERVLIDNELKHLKSIELDYLADDCELQITGQGEICLILRWLTERTEETDNFTWDGICEAGRILNACGYQVKPDSMGSDHDSAWLTINPPAGLGEGDPASPKASPGEQGGDV